MKRLIILGAGTAGTIMANLMRRRLSRAEWAVTVIDRDNEHYYQPGFLFIPFGFYKRENIVKPRAKFLPRGVEFIIAEVDRIDPIASKIVFQDGSDLPYDYLIVATGAEIVPAETPGMLDGWRDTIFDFYTPDGATALAAKLAAFPGGRIVIHVNETPIKCPVAPLEFAFFCDDCLRRHHRRDKIELVFVTPLPGAFTKPVASKTFGTMLDEKRIQMVTDFNAERIDAAARKIVGYDGREVPYDLLVTVPTNMGSEMIERSGMGNEFRYLPTDPRTLRSKKYENDLRHRRRDGPAVVQGRLGGPFPGRDPGREPRARDRGKAARARVRRALELLHRGRQAQGHPDRLQLRGRAAARPLPVPAPGPDAAPQAEPPQPLGQARFPLDLLAHPAAGTAHPVRAGPDEDGGEKAPRGRWGRRGAECGRGRRAARNRAEREDQGSRIKIADERRIAKAR